MSEAHSNSKKWQSISLGNYGGPTFIGRPNGEAARKKLKLDELDCVEDLCFEIDIPESTYNINSSYFLGLFGDSIRKAGSEEAFLQRFRFNTHGREYPVISRGIARALIRDKSLGLH